MEATVRRPTCVVARACVEARAPIARDAQHGERSAPKPQLGPPRPDRQVDGGGRGSRGSAEQVPRPRAAATGRHEYGQGA
eukprot:11642289-Alexandrium_andersonii.AAC.1